MIDATGPARALLRDEVIGGSDLDRLIAALAPHFAGLEDRLAGLESGEQVAITGLGSRPLSISAGLSNGVTRLEIFDALAEGRGVLVDGLSKRADEVELSLLRTAVAAAPVLAWRTGADGAVDWANRAYLDRVAEHLGLRPGDLTWPVPLLFDQRQDGTERESRRMRIVSPDPTRGQWYECRATGTPDGRFCFATPIDATVRAEAALREFVQTLTKTFAQLPIGLAIFDRQRQLALFNPALIDLTRLNPEMLSARPTLFAFLDSLREARMIPEPKDYPSWRRAMAELEKAASSGLYEETWTLPTGQTHRVTGRPHPDGAVAFLFEDITADISLTRRFRSEIEMGQAVIDKIDDAIAVFSQAGGIVLSNASYDGLWNLETHSTLGTMTISSAIAEWNARSCNRNEWEAARDFVVDIAPRDDLSLEAELSSGLKVAGHFSRLNGGGTMVRFRRVGRTQSVHRVRLRFRPEMDTVAAQ
ncbi:MAG: PAS-domain containing protein [Paracoccaceae bacterium]